MLPSVSATPVVGAQEAPYGQGPGVTGAHTLPRTGEGPTAAPDILAVIPFASILLIAAILALAARARRVRGGRRRGC